MRKYICKRMHRHTVRYQSMRMNENESMKINKTHTHKPTQSSSKRRKRRKIRIKRRYVCETMDEIGKQKPNMICIQCFTISTILLHIVAIEAPHPPATLSSTTSLLPCDIDLLSENIAHILFALRLDSEIRNRVILHGHRISL